MSIEIPLLNIQQEQLANLIIRVTAHGFGRIEIRIEKGEARWFRPTSTIYNPRSQPYIPIESRTLAELLGAWRDAFVDVLCSVLGARYGSVFIGIDHGGIHYIEAAPDVRVRTGQTGPLISDRPPCGPAQM